MLPGKTADLLLDPRRLSIFVNTVVELTLTRILLLHISYRIFSLLFLFNFILSPFLLVYSLLFKSLPPRNNERDKKKKKILGTYPLFVVYRLIFITFAYFWRSLSRRGKDGMRACWREVDGKIDFRRKQPGRSCFRKSLETCSRNFFFLFLFFRLQYFGTIVETWILKNLFFFWANKAG